MIFTIFRKRLMLAACALLAPLLWLLPASPAAADIDAASGWKSIAVGTTHNLGVKLDGTVWTWGAGDAELFGRTEAPAVQDIPLKVVGLTNIVQAAAGGSHSLALRDDGTVWAWGGNTEGEIGDGTNSVFDGFDGGYIINNNKSVPAQVEGVGDAVYIAAGHSSSYAVKKDGTVWAWGSLNGKRPVQLTEYTDVRSISVGYGHIAVLKRDGTVWQRADSLPAYRNGHSQNLGLTTLVQIEGLTNVVAVVAGGGTTHALKDDGSVWGWGFNHEGEIGDGTTIDRPDPVRITGIRDVTAIAASAGGPLYLKRDGSLWSNGSNLGGQLGIGSYENKLAPTRIEGLVKIKRIASSGIGFRAMAIRQDNTLWSWGNGYVGDGTKWWRTSPVWIGGAAGETLTALPLTVEVNGKPVDFDQQPMIKDGRTLVPLRPIFEALGADIEWNERTKTVTATRGNTTAKLTIGEAVGYVDGKAVALEAPAVAVNGRTMVPARFAGETFGALVDWDDGTRTVIIELDEARPEARPETESPAKPAIPNHKPKPDGAVGRFVGKDGSGIPELSVLVHAMSESASSPSATMSDSNGYFTISGLEKGQTYQIIYSREIGSSSNRTVIAHNGIHYCRNQSDIFTFTPLQALEPIVLEQTQLTGKLLDQHGKPVTNIFLVVKDKDGKHTGITRFMTGDDGTYSLCGLAENETYTITLFKLFVSSQPMQSFDFRPFTFTYRPDDTTLPDLKVTITNLRS